MNKRRQLLDILSTTRNLLKIGIRVQENLNNSKFFVWYKSTWKLILQYRFEIAFSLFLAFLVNQIFSYLISPFASVMFSIRAQLGFFLASPPDFSILIALGLLICQIIRVIFIDDKELSIKTCLSISLISTLPISILLLLLSLIHI